MCNRRSVLDEYIYCQSIGMSHEDGTVVSTPLKKLLSAGSAGIVSHAKRTEVNVIFIRF